jgi:hypothetical protein
LEAPPPLAFGTAELVFGKQFSETRTGDYYEDDPPIRWPNRRTVFREPLNKPVKNEPREQKRV